MKRILKFVAILFFVLILIAGAAFVLLPLPGDIPVLMYHFVGSAEDAKNSKNFVSREGFARQVEFLHRFGYHVISLDEFYEIKTGKRKARGRELVLTFDDGNYSFETEAFPVLKRYELPVNLFLVSESVKHGTNGSMTVETVKKLLANPWIHAEGHTKTHPFLSQLTQAQIDDELKTSKTDLEQMLGVPIHFLAYSSGDFDQRVMDTAKDAGYFFAFTTSPKKLKNIPEGPYAMTRIKVTDSADNLIAYWGQISGLYGSFKHFRHRLKQSR